MDAKIRLKEIRKALGLKQKEFGAKLGVQGNSVCNWETGIGEMTRAKIELMIETFRVRREWLETGEGEMFSKSREPPPNPKDFATAHGFSAAAGAILERYCSLDDEEKLMFERIVDRLFSENVEKPDKRGRESPGSVVNNVNANVSGGSNVIRVTTRK